MRPTEGARAEDDACTAPGIERLDWTRAARGRRRVSPPRALTPDEEAQLSAIAADASTGEAEAALARAAVWATAGRWDRVALTLHPVATGDAAAGDDGSVARSAAVRYLEALATLAAHGRPSCTDAVVKDAPALYARHCPSQDSPTEDCVALGMLDADVRRLDVENAYSSALRASDAGALGHVGDRFFALYAHDCAEPRARGRPALARCAEVLYRAAMAFLAGGDPARARAVRDEMAEPRSGAAGTPEERALACRLDGPRDGGACAPP